MESVCLMESRSHLVQNAAARAARYLETINERRVAPSAEAVEALQRLAGPLPAQPTSPSEVLALLDEIGSPATVANAGGRFFGFVNGGSVPASLLVNILAAAWDQNAALRVMSPVSATLEDIALGWVASSSACPPLPLVLL